MKAHAQSLRIAPKKANLIAKLVRGMSVPDAMESLRKTHKKGARMVELLLRSAIANASHNDKQDPQMMVIKSIVVNQGQAYRRGMPMARGRTRPFRKFLSHIDLELGFPNEEKAKKGTKGTKATKVASTKKSSSSTK
jgi:large subunit ribosomal protein L22